jgi:acyl-CoA thioesterase FadM
MQRKSSYELILDAGLFTPTQLQSVAVARLGFQAGTRWLRDHVCSHRDLISRHKVGLVLWAWQLRYDKPLTFADADEAAVDVCARMRGPRASQLEVAMTISGPAGVAVQTVAAAVPLRLSGDRALSGAPARMPESLVGRFLDDERDPSPFRSPVPALRAALGREGQLVASRTAVFRVHRHHCEMADQWYWAESLGFSGAAREEFIMQHGCRLPELRRALAEGIRRVDAMWLRAGSLWDVLEIRTTGYRYRDGSAFVHELSLADDHDKAPCAIIVEQA